jgi:hypothetical protein
MITHALETTKHEIDSGYNDLTRLLNSGRGKYAVDAAISLTKVDANELWKFLKNYASTDLNYRDTEHLRVLDALYNSWVQDPTNAVFVAHAVLTLANATKTRSESVLKFLPNKY